jgi:hypothetical protein
MPETEETPKPQRKIEYRAPADGLRTVYCNNVQMSSTSFDIRMLFGEIAEVLDDKVVVDQRVQVTMTWLEAKFLADFLQANIKAYEDLNGPVKLPKNLDKLIVPDTFAVLKTSVQ